MRSRKAGLPFATRARKRELSIQEVRIENDSDQKFSKTQFFQSFSENHFFPRFMSPWSLWAENIFPFSESGSTLRYTILDSRVPPCNAISEGRPPLCNISNVWVLTFAPPPPCIIKLSWSMMNSLKFGLKFMLGPHRRIVVSHSYDVCNYTRPSARALCRDCVRVFPAS